MTPSLLRLPLEGGLSLERVYHSGQKLCIKITAKNGDILFFEDIRLSTEIAKEEVLY